MRIFVAFLLLISIFFADAIDVMLAHKMGKDFDPSGWYMSEKFDGVRAFWDGKNLYTRGKNHINAPEFLTAKLPKIALDGELWTSRNSFEEIASIVALNDPADWRWQKVHYLIFDAPLFRGDFEARLNELKKHKDIELIRQIICEGKNHLESFHKEVEAKGGEGVILRDPASLYEEGKRTKSYLKFKSFDDNEAVIIGYKMGKGKYQNMVGSFEVEADGKRFFVGSGLTDEIRKNPPPIGSVITYKHSGYTKNGLPKFATLWRVRGD